MPMLTETLVRYNGVLFQLWTIPTKNSLEITRIQDIHIHSIYDATPAYMGKCRMTIFGDKTALNIADIRSSGSLKFVSLWN